MMAWLRSSGTSITPPTNSMSSIYGDPSDGKVPNSWHSIVGTYRSPAPARAPPRETTSCSHRLWRHCAAPCRLCIFSDHSTISADFDMDLAATTFLAWPLPSQIQWDAVDTLTWSSTCPTSSLYQVGTDPSYFLSKFSKEFESSLDGYVPGSPENKLPVAFRGRGQRTTPKVCTSTPPNCRASRPGEVKLNYDLPGQAVLRWYRQLRRLQSDMHAARAAKTTIDAQHYRAELWASICRSSGFNQPFPSWWDNHMVDDIGALPVPPPSAWQAEWIYAAFEQKFREFEQWHFQRRLEQITAKREHSNAALFLDLRSPQRDQIDALWTETNFTILAADPDSGQVHLDSEARATARSSWTLDDQPLHVHALQGDIIRIAPDIQPPAGSCVTQR